MDILSLRLVWGILTFFSACMALYLVFRKRELDKEYEERFEELQADIDRIEARNAEYLAIEKEKIDKMAEYWREELRKIGIPDPLGE